ncbi:MAG: hypothetical protein SFV55_05495 [Haliscomenobacter sp.]|uniref:hypothetical protein n=1 Tax=Haliscomenobacter sp. TaxID=2717303 RepID=UPI0029A2849C|nr:hypothetical protein [Haliscomenobacter sp.]MDX2067857.1 hypothetical protein [Haliscomenobacter sp.]
MQTLFQQIYTRFFPDPQVIPWIGGTKLSKATWAFMQEKGIPTLDQLNNMAFILDLLRPGDVFVAAGVNTGAYSILASGVRSAYAYRIESNPAAFEHLQTNIQLNHLEKLVTPIQLTPATPSDEAPGAPILNGQGQHTHDTSPVPLHAFNQYIRRMPDVISIDPQALEMDVFQKGLQFLLTPYLKVILFEQPGQTKAGIPPSLQQQLLDLQFETYTYEPELKKLHPIHPAETHSSIVYCRDPEWVQLRVSIADKVKAFSPSLETRN